MKCTRKSYEGSRRVGNPLCLALSLFLSTSHNHPVFSADGILLPVDNIVDSVIFAKSHIGKTRMLLKERSIYVSTRITMYFHDLPVELEQYIFKLTRQIERQESIEREYDTFVEAIDERRVEFWENRYSCLKEFAKINGVKCKGTKYIVDNLFSLDNKTLSISGYDPENCYIIAFAHYSLGGRQTIINAQQVKLGESIEINK